MKVFSVLSFSEVILVLLILNKIKIILSDLGNVDIEILHIYSNRASMKNCVWMSSILTEKSLVFGSL